MMDHNISRKSLIIRFFISLLLIALYQILGFIFFIFLVWTISPPIFELILTLFKPAFEAGLITYANPGGNIVGATVTEPLLFTRVPSTVNWFGFFFSHPQMDVMVPVTLIKPYHGSRRIIDIGPGAGLSSFKYF